MLLVDNEGISHTIQMASILSGTHMIAYGMDVDDYPTTFIWEGKKGRSILIANLH